MSQAKRLELATRNGTIKRVHVNQHLIRQGLPAMTVQTSAGSLAGQRVEILGPSTLVQSENPLSCGAKVWIETTSPVKIEGRKFCNHGNDRKEANVSNP